MREHYQWIHERYRLSTFAKYFLSYAIVLLVLFLGFLIISQQQLHRIFAESSYHNAQRQTETVEETLYTVLDAMAATNVELLEATQQEIFDAAAPEWRDYRIMAHIRAFERSNHMVDSIIYFNEEHNKILSQKYIVRHTEGGLTIGQFGEEHSFYLPLTKPAKDITADTLYLLVDGDEQLLVFSSSSSGYSYRFFFILDNNAVKTLFQSALGDTLDSFALVDHRTGVYMSTEKEILAPLLHGFMPQDKVFTQRGAHTLYTQTTIMDSYSLVAVISHAKITAQVGEVFFHTFLLLLLVGAVCMALVFAAMRLTYWPLKRLLFQLSPAAQLDKSYVLQLQETFQEAQEKSIALQNKYDSYRINIQKTLLEPVLAQHIGTNMQFSYPNIDLLFTQPIGTRFYLLYCHHAMSKINSSTPYAIQSLVEERLHGKALPILLANSADTSVLILCLTGELETSDAELESLLMEMNRQIGVRSAISDASLSPLDVPVLYDRMIAAAEKLGQMPVAVYTHSDLPEASPAANYPIALFKQLEDHLDAQRYPAAHHALDDILMALQNTGSSQKDYFIRFILLDVLSSVINCMVKHQVSSDTYYTAYAEALFLCRTYDNGKDQTKVAQVFHDLLTLCERSIQEKGISKMKLDAVIRQNYTNPNFSITEVADMFGTGATYMSVLFLKLCGMNFTDYLWKVRLEKFEELSLTTDMTVEKISQEIGYEHVSSFRRKLKSATGMSPSEYRAHIQKNVG